MRINFTLAHIEAFVAVAEVGNFRVAAQQLHISQPAVTLRIKQLEERIGLPLFTRTTRSVYLTPAGQRFLEGSKGIMSNIEDVARSLRDEANLHQGIISVVALPSVAATILPRMLRQFSNAFPGISFRIMDATPGRANDLLSNGEVDLAITSQKPHPGMEFSFLLRDPCMAIASKNHPFASRQNVTLEDLASQPLLLYPPYTIVRQVLDDAFLTIGRVIEPVYEAVSANTLVALAEAEYGITFAPSLYLNRIHLGDCVKLDLHEPLLDRDFGILRAKKARSPAVKAFIDFCTSIDWTNGLN